MKRYFQQYKNLINGPFHYHNPEKVSEITFSQDQLFLNFLAYCSPVILFAVVPGVYMSIKDGLIPLAIIDIVSLLLLLTVAFWNTLSITLRKCLACAMFYALSVFLIFYLGYIGPGIFYLFTITVLLALILPITVSYYSIALNTVILGCFALIIKFKLFGCALAVQYSPGKWIALSSNLVVGSIVIITLIDQIFAHLQVTITTKGNLQQRYQNLFDLSPVPMWLFDTNTLSFLDVNKAATRQYGHSRNEFLHMTIKDIRPAETIDDLKNIVSQNAITSDFYSGTAKHLTRNGDCILVKIESNPISFDGYQARLVLSTDVTAQLRREDEILRANAKIKESESNLRAIFESANDGFVLLDASYDIKIFNHKATEHIQFNKVCKPFKVGENIFEFIERSKHEFFRTSLHKVKGGEIVAYDKKYRKSGVVKWVHYTLTPVYDDAAICGVCITGRDITVRKTYIDRIEMQNKALRDISWMQSHLVRAPLARIMGITALLMKEADLAEQEILLNYLNVSCHELDDIIKKITLDSSNNNFIHNYIYN